MMTLKYCVHDSPAAVCFCHRLYHTCNQLESSRLWLQAHGDSLEMFSIRFICLDQNPQDSWQCLASPRDRFSGHLLDHPCWDPQEQKRDAVSPQQEFL